MKYYTIPSAASLSPYVRFFWVLEHDGVTTTQTYTHRSMADGCCELVFHYQGRFTDLAADGTANPSFTSGVSGPSQSYSRFYTDEAFGIFGVYLYPYAVAAFFGVPASAIANQQVALSALLGRPGREIEEKVMLAADNNERAAILTAFFELQISQRYKQPPPVFSAIKYIIKSKGTITVDALAQKHFLSTRQFERNFKEFAGFSPKLYSRIIRFQSAIEKYRDKNTSLTQIAYDCGYYDQSHFIRDFKQFSGYHPKTYFSGNNEGTDWKEAE
jgi:AraC-like DNA-binding protein